MTHKTEYNKRHKQSADQSNSKRDISRISKIPLSILDDVFDRGIGAFKTNRSSVRPSVSSKEQWAMARVYAFVNKMEKGSKLNHDIDLAKKVKWYKK